LWSGVGGGVIDDDDNGDCDDDDDDIDCQCWMIMIMASHQCDPVYLIRDNRKRTSFGASFWMRRTPWQLRARAATTGIEASLQPCCPLHGQLFACMW
jgi:hypothetical protein